jgi:hypothetical protein
LGIFIRFGALYIGNYCGGHQGMGTPGMGRAAVILELDVFAAAVER